MNTAGILRPLCRLLSSRTGVLWGGMSATMLLFVVDWSAATTFRGMSDWILYPVNILAALLIVLPYLLTRRVWVQLIFMAAVQGLLLSNVMYCRTYLSAIPAQSYALAGNLSDFTASVTDSLRWLDLGFPAILIITALVAYRTPRTQLRHILMPYAAATLILAALAAAGIMAKGGFYREYDRLSQSCYKSTCGPVIYTIGGHLIYSAMSRDTGAAEAAEQAARQWIADHAELAPYTPLPDSTGRRTSLVVVLLESFESWLVETDIDGQPIAPYLRSLAHDSTTLYAPHVLTQVASGRSIDCQLLLNAGLLPMTQAVYSMKYPATHYPSLNKAMRERYGTRSLLLTCDKPITWNQAAISRSFGCDSLIDRSAWVHDEMVGNPPKLADRSFLRQSVAMLRQGHIWPEGESAYLTFVTYSGHNPFRLPDRLKDSTFRPDPKRYPGKLVDYVTMARYTDSSLRQLIDYIKSRSDYDSTLVVITGDHEGLAGDRRELLRHPAAAILVDPRQFTPLIILNSPVAGRREDVMGQIDIYPTLLNLLGLDSYWWKGMGRSIVAPGAPTFAISSMTNEVAGDTTCASSAMMSHLREARRASDTMIARDLFSSE